MSKYFFSWKFSRSDTYARVLQNLPLLLPKKHKFLNSRSKQFEKKTFFQSKFSKIFHLDTCIAVLTHLDSLFAKGRKNRCSSKIHAKKQNFSGKRNYFPQIIFLDPRVVLWEPWKKFSVNSSCFLAQSPKKIETMCKVSSNFSLKVFQGYVGYSSDNSGEFLSQRKIKSSLRIFNKVVIYFVFEKGFSLICSSEHLFQFRQPWRKTFANVPWTYFSGSKSG